MKGKYLKLSSNVELIKSPKICKKPFNYYYRYFQIS